mgnify:CR=1 FL=1
MDCPVLACDESLREAGTISKFLNSCIIKNIPKTPPTFEAESTLFTHLLGNLISKYPKNEIAKTINTIKKIILTQALVAIAFKEPGSIEKK